MSKISISVVLGLIVGNLIHFFLYTNQIIDGNCYNGLRWGGSCKFSFEGWKRTIFVGEYFPTYAIVIVGAIFAFIFLFMAAKYLKDDK